MEEVVSVNLVLVENGYPQVTTKLGGLDYLRIRCRDDPQEFVDIVFGYAAL